MFLKDQQMNPKVRDLLNIHSSELFIKAFIIIIILSDKHKVLLTFKMH